MEKKKIVVLGVLILVLLGVAWFFILSSYLPADVKITSVTIYPRVASKGHMISVEIRLKNNLAIPQKVYFEAGIIPHKPFSVFPFGITFGGKCCPANENYDGRWIILAPYEETTVIVQPRMPTETTYDHCHNQGSYWKGPGTYYVEIAVTTACWGQPGYKLLDYKVETVQMV